MRTKLGKKLAATLDLGTLLEQCTEAATRINETAAGLPAGDHRLRDLSADAVVFSSLAAALARVR